MILQSRDKCSRIILPEDTSTDGALRTSCALPIRSPAMPISHQRPHPYRLHFLFINLLVKELVRKSGAWLGASSSKGSDENLS